MNITYREAAPEDAAALLDYFRIIGGESDNLTFGSSGLPLTLDQEAEILTVFRSSPHSVFLLALDGDEIVGNASLTGDGNPRFRHRCNLAIAVRRSHWSRGIASGLMEGLLCFARNNGIEVIDLQVRSDHAAAIGLYEKFGFRKIGTFEKFFKVKDRCFDAECMNLYL